MKSPIQKSTKSTQNVKKMAASSIRKTSTASKNVDYQKLIEDLFADVTEAPSEETLRDQEANILQLGERLREEGRAKEMTDLIHKVRTFLKFMSKAKAAKLVRGLVDMFLDMERTDDNGETKVQLCKVRKGREMFEPK